MENNIDNIIHQKIEKNYKIIHGIGNHQEICKRIKILSGQYDGGNTGHFTLSINGKKLEADIKLNKYIDGRQRDVMVIENGRNSIVLNSDRHGREAFTEENIKDTLISIALGDGYAQYSTDEGYNERNRNEIILGLQKLFIKEKDKVRYNKYQIRQRINDNLNRINDNLRRILL